MVKAVAKPEVTATLTAKVKRADGTIEEFTVPCEVVMVEEEEPDADSLH